MLPKQAVKAVHQALQTIYSDSEVVLGGSHWTGEAAEESDLDFYILRPWLHFFGYKQFLPAVEKLKQQYSGTTINCMVLPRFFYKRGWYFVAGETVSGEILRSPLNTKIVFRSSIKLAYWNYILFLTDECAEKKQFCLTKMAQHLAIAQIVQLPVVLPEKGLTTQFIISQLSENSPWEPARKLLVAKKIAQVFTASELEALSTELLSLLEHIFVDGHRYWRFSLVNYLIYNAKFLRHKDPLFLFKNPDKMIVVRLREGLKSRASLSRLREEMRTVIFPVIMI